MTESDALRQEIYRLAAAAEADSETTSNLKALLELETSVLPQRPLCCVRNQATS